MKIQFIINSLEGGGAERVVCTLTRYLVGVGNDVRIVTLHGGEVAYELPSSVRVDTLQSRRLMRGWARLAAVPVVAAELAAYLAGAKPDVAMSFLTRSNLAHLMTRRLGNTAPIYISERIDAEAEYVKAKAPLGWMLSALYPQADHIVAISEGVRISLGQKGVPLDLVTTIHNPQDLDRIRADAAVGRLARPQGGPFRIVMAGRLTRQKDYPTMLDALAILKSRGNDVQLVVLGDGEDRQALEEKARTLGVASLVDWRGWTKDAYTIMGACDAFAFTSIYEGFGNVLVEAMAAGLPSVTTDCPSGPAEIVAHGKYGMLVPMRDPRALADAFDRLMSDRVVYEGYQARAREGAARFDVATAAEKYLRVLRGELSRGAPARLVDVA